MRTTVTPCWFKRADIVPQLPAKLDVDARGRLVEHQDRRRVDHRLGHQQPPLHAARQGARISVGLVGQMHRGEQLVGLPLAPWRIPYSPAWISSASRGREERVEQDLLRDDPDRAFGVARVLVDVEAPDGRPAAAFADQPGEDVDQRRLAGAVGAEQPEDLAARHVEADVVERQLALAALARIGLRQRFDSDCGPGSSIGPSA